MASPLKELERHFKRIRYLHDFPKREVKKEDRKKGAKERERGREFIEDTGAEEGGRECIYLHIYICKYIHIYTQAHILKCLALFSEMQLLYSFVYYLHIS